MVPLKSTYVKKALSHPGKTLKQHTMGVLQRALVFCDDYRVRMCALFHDVGKLNDNFQKKLAGLLAKGSYSNHSYISFLSILNYFSERQYRPGLIANNQDLILISTCVLKHHGGLPDLFRTINQKPSDDGKTEMGRVDEFLKTNPYLPAADLLNYLELEKDPLTFTLHNVPNKKVLALFNRTNLTKWIPDPLQFFFDIRMCFSALVAADKGDAGNQGNQKMVMELTNEFHEVYGSRLGQYIETLPPITELNKIRTEIRKSAVAKLKNILIENPEQRVFCLTEPTGAGKTVTLLALAKELLDTTAKRLKIIYSIPFLSITEQIEDIIEGAIMKENARCVKRIDCKAQPEFDASSITDDYGQETMMKKLKAMLIKVFKGKTPRDEMVNTVLLNDYLESTFDYPLIITTFVQFFQSFTTASNKGLMRFSSLRNSIFLIDEIQALPSRLYSFFVAMLDSFCREYECYAVISTATMPSFEISAGAKVQHKEIFKDYHPPIELGDLNHFNLPIFNRYEIHVEKTPMTVDGLSMMILKETQATLVVCNTIRDSRQVYDLLKSTSAKGTIIKLMNSNFYSAGRRFILGECKDMLNKKEKFFFVTTSLIEAGVDIDFPIVYRDIAPLPNVIQVGGRCNREGKLDKGIMHLVQIIDSKGKLRARTIYKGLDGPFLNYAIDQLINSGQLVFEEKDLMSIQKGFFSFMAQSLEFGKWTLKNESGLQESVNFAQQILEFKYQEIGRYTVIPPEQYGAQERFYVPYSENEEGYEEHKDDYEKLWTLLAEKEELDTAEVKKGFDKIREIILRGSQLHSHLKVMMDRVVQVNIPEGVEVKNLVEHEEPVCYMYKLKPGYYDSEYGLIL